MMRSNVEFDPELRQRALEKAKKECIASTTKELVNLLLDFFYKKKLVLNYNMDVNSFAPTMYSSLDFDSKKMEALQADVKKRGIPPTYSFCVNFLMANYVNS